MNEERNIDKRFMRMALAEAEAAYSEGEILIGAVVVCQGAGSSGVRLAVTEAVAALTGLPADRITVVQWNS